MRKAVEQYKEYCSINVCSPLWQVDVDELVNKISLEDTRSREELKECFEITRFILAAERVWRK